MSSNKIKITDYMKLSKEDRQKHIDLSTECEFYYSEKDYNWKGKIKKAGDLYCKAKQSAQAKKELIKKLGIEEFCGNKIHVCHLCDCNSTSDKVCINPAHLYFGTALENHLDIPFEIRSETGKIGGKKTIENKTHNMLKRDTCKYCGYESTVIVIKRAHNDNCKHKHISVISPDISSFIPETVSQNLE